ncbi:cytochrome c oxidase subunit 3 [Olivibacter sp. SDN3]|uniref:cytochrome c oxidase subunit 3 n=1 Tax=Olivibacter sp. SDN3 TaxID=2764720 RepID=UPI001651149E|nr:cytochrome c oxidase subunit 3 [Olivibacter sp. SDN3]QNL51353.1 cytochrome c oxidase subunit 3 [Olivibacter sp. SDN3]
MVQPRENEDYLVSLKAKRFSLYVFLVVSFMLFAAWSSGFIVYTASGADKGLKTLLPNTFIYSTLVILISSFSIHLSHRAAKVGDFLRQKIWLGTTIILGCLFFVLQYMAWMELANRGVLFINNNASQSFIYVFVWAHQAHIFAGIIVLLNALFKANDKQPLIKNNFRMELATIFWHFLDILWIYIYVFLLLNQ